MTLSDKNDILDYIEELRNDDKYNDIADLLIALGNEIYGDYELSCLLAEAFIELSDGDDINYAETAETILQSLKDKGENDPRWHELMARSLYCQNFIYDAVYHLKELFRLLPPTDDARRKYSRAASLLKILTVGSESETERYSHYEIDELKEHIEYYFGKITWVIPDSQPVGIRTDIAVIAPDLGHEYYTLVTLGMGAHYMNVPKEFRNRSLERAELVCYLPADWDIENHPFNKCWQVRQMLTIAHLPIEQDSWIGFGFMLPNGAPYADDTELCCTTLIHVQDVEDGAGMCILDSGKAVRFYQIFPLYVEEAKFKVSKGISELIEKMPHISAVIDPKRENVCEGYCSSGAAAIVGKEIDMLGNTDIDIGEYCTASRRITDDGCKVGYMRRFLSASEDGDSADSGWLMLAGDESQEYLSEPYNLSLYRINTICNIDHEIIPFLDMPYDTEVIREIDGKLRIIKKDVPDENDVNYS